MKIATVSIDGAPRVAVIDTTEAMLRPVRGVRDMIDLIGQAPDALRLDQAAPFHHDMLLAPVPLPHRNIFCVGKNYASHAREFAQSGFDAGGGRAVEIETHPVVFTKPPSSVIGPHAIAPLHAHLTASVDYEAELAVIIGRGGRDIPAARAHEHVFGYTILNDITARDRQRDHRQWFLGKGLDGFCPMGPWITTADEVDAADLRIQCWVNGELRQDASTRDLIFDIPTLIATLSAGLTLLPGDIIATGTPAGVGIGFDPPRFLTSGDRVRISIEGLGTLETRFEA